jgi:hypothetical protein
MHCKFVLQPTLEHVSICLPRLSENIFKYNSATKLFNENHFAYKHHTVPGQMRLLQSRKILNGVLVIFVFSKRRFRYKKH